MLWKVDEMISVATIVQEASNQGAAGMLAVAEVIRDRTARRIQSDGTLLSTCLWPWAFSGWNTRDPNRLRSLRAVLAETRVVFEALEAWRRATEEGTMTACGADHYYAPAAMVPKDSVPPWAKGKEPVAVIGDQRFYRLVP